MAQSRLTVRAFVLLGAIQGSALGGVPEAVVVKGVPPRAKAASTGTEFSTRTKGWSGEKRQRLAVKELLAGNLPDYMRRLVPVQLEGSGHRVTIWVTPDYLSVGSRLDALIVPLTFPAACQVAAGFGGMLLPTTKMVDAIYAQAAERRTPAPMPPGPGMRSSEAYLRHRKLVRASAGSAPLGSLVAGHKKDVVLSARLRKAPDRIAIYGWHRPNGRPIQPLSTVHAANYADYSHGVRLVWPVAWVDGEPRSLYEVLEDAEIAGVVSRVGALEDPEGLMRSGAEAGKPTPRSVGKPLPRWIEKPPPRGKASK